MIRFPKSAAMALAGALMALGLAAPARADEPSTEAIELAGQVLDDVGVRFSVEAIPPGLLLALVRNIGSIHPEMRTALGDAAATIAPEYAKSGGKVLDDLAQVLAARMTVEELRDTKAFFESPVGKKYLATQPVILQELAVSANAWRSELSEDLLKRLREEMKKKGYDF